MSDSSQHLWTARARETALRVNAGWFLHFLLLPVFGYGVAASALLLIARAQGWPLLPLAGVLAALLLATTVTVFVLARRRFFTLDDALVRLDAHARLDNRLTAAAAGVGDWPAFDEKADPGLGWRLRRIAAPFVAAALCLVGAALVPIPKSATANAGAIQEPSSWSQVDQWMNTLAEEKVVEEQDLKTFEEQLDALRRQPQQNWYTHSSLEAGDQLRDQARQAIQEFDRNLALAESAMNSAMSEQGLESGDLEDPDGARNASNKNPSGSQQNDPASGANKNGQKMSPAAQQALNEQWKKALEGLKSGALKLDAKTMSDLQKIDPSKLKLVDAKLIKGQLKKGSKACKNCALAQGKGDQECDLMMLVEGATQASCNKPGMGGVTRGRGDAPLTFNADEAQAGSSKTEGVSNQNYERATLGDTVGMQDGAHKVDENAYKGPAAGGTASQPGGAGETVWRTEALPEEQGALERYFKGEGGK